MTSKKIFILSTSVVATFVAFNYFFNPTPETKRYPSSITPFSNPIPNELGETWNAEDQQNSNKVLAIIESALDKSTAGASVMKRDAHPKHHGCVKANLTIDTSALSKDLQVGVFSPNRLKNYNTWIRFSNGSPDAEKADKKGDVRGMALKLMKVDGSSSGSQDFLFMNSKVFFIKDSKEYADFMEATEGTASLLWFLATHSHTRQVILAAQGMKVGNPLHIDYHTATPYKLGNKAVKYTMKTCTPVAKRDSIPNNPNDNFLRERLVGSLHEAEKCFDLYVQVSKDPKTMPVEDSTVEWNESKSPLIKVARLTIPKQTGIDSANQIKFCENLSFDPWHTLPEHRPLGNINRIRLNVYSAISKKRHEYNNIPQIEPQDFAVCTGKTEALCR